MSAHDKAKAVRPLVSLTVDFCIRLWRYTVLYLLVTRDPWCRDLYRLQRLKEVPASITDEAILLPRLASTQLRFMHGQRERERQTERQRQRDRERDRERERERQRETERERERDRDRDRDRDRENLMLSEIKPRIRRLLGSLTVDLSQWDTP